MALTWQRIVFESELSTLSPRLNRIINASSSTTLSATQLDGTIVTNVGQTTADVTVTLAAAAAGMSFIGVVGTPQSSNVWQFQCGTADKIMLDGSSGTTNGIVKVTPAKGNFITFFTYPVDATAYEWIAESGRGTWSSTTAPA